MPKTRTRAIKESALDDLVDRAMEGDVASIAQLKTTWPEGFLKLLDTFGDVARQAERILTVAVAGDNTLVRDGLQRRLAAMRQELAGPRATPLEALLVEHVVATWLQVQHADRRCAALVQVSHVPLAMRDHYDRWRDRAHGRQLRAIKSLATVRRLLLPAVQLNLAERQVNVMGVAGDINVGADGSR